MDDDHHDALPDDCSGPGDSVDELIGWLDTEPEDVIDSVIYELRRPSPTLSHVQVQ